VVAPAAANNPPAAPSPARRGLEAREGARGGVVGEVPGLPLALQRPPSLLHLHKALHRVPSVLSKEQGPRPNAAVGGGGVQRHRLRVLLVRLQQRLSLNTVLRNPK
jgi:hypothetical protein